MSCSCMTSPMPPCGWCENGGVQGECASMICFHDCSEECKTASLDCDEFRRYVLLPQRQKELYFTREEESFCWQDEGF